METSNLLAPFRKLSIQSVLQGSSNAEAAALLLPFLAIGLIVAKNLR